MPNQTYKELQRIQQGLAVRQVLERAARRIASAATTEAVKDGVTPVIEVSSGVRPKGRAYARVSMTPGAHEFGDAKTARRRILARALARRS